jgi:hypothetical protein
MTKNFTNAPISPLPPAYWRALLVRLPPQAHLALSKMAECAETAAGVPLMEIRSLAAERVGSQDHST